MKELIVPIDFAGRIVLPKEIREELAIAPGDRFHVSADGGQVTLIPERGTTGLVRKGKALVFAAPGQAKISNAEVEHLIRDNRESLRGGGVVRGSRRRR
jgi:AbrB family looped-hinge helix DNA binding protein